jgi:fatty acid amide hydrolase
VRLKERLNVGFIESEEFIGNSLTGERALREAAGIFKELGHNVFPVKIPNFEKLILLTTKIWSSDGSGKNVSAQLKGERAIAEVQSSIKFRNLPNVIITAIQKLMGLIGQKRISKFVEQGKSLNAEELLQALFDLLMLRQEFYKFWRENMLDAILMPVAAVPAVKHGAVKDVLPACVGYTLVGSMFNLPAGSLPITRVRHDEQRMNKMAEDHNDLLQKKLEKNMQGSEGLPVGVQIVTLPYEDEKCLEIMKILEGKIKVRDLALDIKVLND